MNTHPRSAEEELNECHYNSVQSHSPTSGPLFLQTGHRGQGPEKASPCWLFTDCLLAISLYSFPGAPCPQGSGCFQWLLQAGLLQYPFCSSSPFPTLEINPCIKSPQFEIPAMGTAPDLALGGGGIPHWANKAIPAAS